MTHAKSNHISDSSYDENKQWGGLSDFGKVLIPEMNKVGIMVDVSHVSDAAFLQAIDISDTKATNISLHSNKKILRSAVNFHLYLEEQLKNPSLRLKDIVFL